MTYALDDFCADCRDALRGDPGGKGKETIRRNLGKLLMNKGFVAAHLGPDVKEGRFTLYKDDELGFLVLAHIGNTARKSPPHDHGPSWAIYGQAVEHTDMVEWRREDGGTGGGEARLSAAREYRLSPGEAGIFDVGDIHSIDYPAGARFVRVTGTDLDRVDRLRFDKTENKAEVMQGVVGPAQ